MLIKTGYPNLLHGCDFLCFNLMNEFENIASMLKSTIRYFRTVIKELTNDNLSITCTYLSAHLLFQVR